MHDLPPARDGATRRTDSLALLSTPAIDVWVATASADGLPHLVPVSLAWAGERVVLAVDGASLTARNLQASGRARLGVGPTRDVVMIDAVLERTAGVDDDAALGEAYAAQADWDPRGLAGYVFLVLRPERLQAWREANETAGRTLLRDGTWVV
ncbi:pyridoxamine 5'-phosphate oxidase family protein [Pimelobacter simplex]|uniref:pyridoxamine 5'-phosphate oxidase family protein n=1 Tax=Nocardioides simplex TaxID=2045 RepID=UPI003AAD3464